MGLNKIASLDNILLELGEFGKYQKINFLLICVPMAFTAFSTIGFVFEAGNPEYRCRVPECEASQPVDYNPNWLSRAIPFEHHAPARCERYQALQPPPGNETVLASNDTCSKVLFDERVIQRCDEFVYASQHTTIANDFNITCKENQWKLTMVGTVSNIGQFVCLPTTGYLSDRYGRRTVMIFGLLLSTVVGLMRSFSPTYLWYMFLIFLDTAVGAGAYSAGFILGVELVGPSKRVLAGTMLSSCYAFGEAILGLVAWATSSWRWMLRCVYLPGFLLASYFWILPESTRWLIAKRRSKDVRRILLNMSRMNHATLNEKTVDCLMINNEGDQCIGDSKQKVAFLQIFKTPVLLMRFLNCILCWITCNVIYYGLSLNSVAVAGSIYMNFIGVSLIEVPGYILTIIFLNKFGRRYTLSGSLIVAGLSCITFIFIPDDHTNIRLIFFLLGKCAATISFTSLYVFTTEMFPTPLRHSVLGTCSMFGRIGSMVAPQTPLLAILWQSLPLVIFGSMATVSGICVLGFPETLNTKLPDTIEEAKNIGKRNLTDD